MFLFIFESIGTSELIMIGIVALIFLGPRKLPDLARKAGKILADLRSTTSDFKSTWEKEVNFEAEEKALRTGEIVEKSVASVPVTDGNQNYDVSAPAIRSVDKEFFDSNRPQIKPIDQDKAEITGDDSNLSDKRNWF